MFVVRLIFICCRAEREFGRTSYTRIKPFIIWPVQQYFVFRSESGHIKQQFNAAVTTRWSPTPSSSSSSWNFTCRWRSWWSVPPSETQYNGRYTHTSERYDGHVRDSIDYKIGHTDRWVFPILISYSLYLCIETDQESSRAEGEEQSKTDSTGTVYENLADLGTPGNISPIEIDPETGPEPTVPPRHAFKSNETVEGYPRPIQSQNEEVRVDDQQEETVSDEPSKTDNIACEDVRYVKCMQFDSFS